MIKDGAQATAVIIAYRKKRLNTRLIFGMPRLEIRRGWHRKLAIFYPGDMFGYKRWRGDKYGTQAWSLVICESVNASPMTRIPGVMPGAKLLLNARGKTKVKRALACLDALKEEQTAPENRPARLWHDLHHRLLAGQKEAEIIDALSRGVPC
ncbi:MAG: DUF2840 domain-containing protein [Pseudomonadota bacterium]